MDVDSSKLRALMDAASEVDSPHVDLSPIGIPARVGLADLHAVAFHHLPSVSIEVAGVEVRISRQDGAVLATLQGVF